jgi:hypothetical protein
VQSLGIYGPADLIDFDHEKFWRDNLLLVDIDYEKFGKLMSNRAHGRKRRTALTKTYRLSPTWSKVINLDWRLGYAWLNGTDHCETMQQLVHQYRKDRIESCLIPVSEAWLRPPSTPLITLNSGRESHTRTQSLERP